MLLAQSSQSRGRPLLFVVSALPMEAMAGGGEPRQTEQRHPAARGGQKQGRKCPAEEEVSGAIQTELKKYHRDLVSQGWAVPTPQTETSPRELTPAEQAYIGQLQGSIEAEKESLQRLREEREAAEALIKAKSDSIKQVKAEIGRLYGMMRKMGRA